MCYLRLIILNFDRMTPKQKKFNEIIVLIDNWVNKIPWNMSEWAIKVNNLLFIALMCHFPLVNTRKMLDNAWYNDICSKSVIERLISMHLFTNFVYYVINVFIKCKMLLVSSIDLLRACDFQWIRKWNLLSCFHSESTFLLSIECFDMSNLWTINIFLQKYVLWKQKMNFSNINVFCEWEMCIWMMKSAKWNEKRVLKHVEKCICYA